MPRFNRTFQHVWCKISDTCAIPHCLPDRSVASYLTSLVNDPILGFETTVLIGCCADTRSLIFRLINTLYNQ